MIIYLFVSSSIYDLNFMLHRYRFLEKSCPHMYDIKNIPSYRSKKLESKQTSTSFPLQSQLLITLHPFLSSLQYSCIDSTNQCSYTSPLNIIRYNSMFKIIYTLGTAAIYKFHKLTNSWFLLPTSLSEGTTCIFVLTIFAVMNMEFPNW